MSINYNADQTAKKTEKLTAVVVKNTTSPEEKKLNSMHYTLVCSIKEILNLNVFENLRVAYTSDESIKRITPKHKEIYESFKEAPNRFIQRHSGFTVICNDINVSSPQEYGINTVTLENASLINGAQSQDLLKKLLTEYEGVEEYENVNVRVEVIVEKALDERIEIAIARNTSTNVSNLSIMGKKRYFDPIEVGLKKILGKDHGLQKSETDDAIPTQTLLQTLRTMTPREIRDEYKSLKDSPVKSYSGKAMVLNEYKDMVDHEMKSQEANSRFESPVLNYYRSFAGYAWLEYEKWSTDKDWIPFWKKSDRYQKIGKYNEKDGTFELTWAILCPLLFGLQHYLYEEKAGAWNIKYSDKFDKKKYMDYVLDRFKDSGFEPQTFAKDRAIYSDLYIFMLDYK
ncbi:AIPR family protein [Gammaproteobacteria bacterium]|nr:AIPR family protein [Gammaproteobacteria bacterium]